MLGFNCLLNAGVSGACGVAPYVQESSGCVLEEPFLQEELNRILPRRIRSRKEDALRTREYARTQDFCGRTPAVLQALEDFVRMEKG